MKICIAASSLDLNSSVNRVFARCAYFLIVDSETGKFKTVVNKAKETERGAGFAAAKTVANLGVQVIICGSIGPNAQMVLEQSGIKVISEFSGIAKEALEKFKTGKI